MIFPVNDFPVFLITKQFMWDLKGFLDSPLHAIDQFCKSSQSLILNVCKYQISRFLQFWCKLNTRGTVKTFLRDYYCDSLNVLFPQFPSHFLPFLMVFAHDSPSVSTVYSGISTVFPQCFLRFIFSILRLNELNKSPIVSLYKKVDFFTWVILMPYVRNKNS